MPFFTPKPVKVHAYQYMGSAKSAAMLVDWISAKGGKAYDDGALLVVQTSTGTCSAWPGDWVVFTAEREFHIYKHPTFIEVYEPS